MEFTEQVLVLRVGTFREADCWVRFFSPTHGLLTGFAFGGHRSRRRFCGCLDHLSVVHFRVSRGRQEYYCLEEGTLINGFPTLKRDLKKLGMVSNCVRFFESLSFTPDGYAPAYALLLETLEALDRDEHLPALEAHDRRAEGVLGLQVVPSFLRGDRLLLAGSSTLTFPEFREAFPRLLQ